MTGSWTGEGMLLFTFRPLPSGLATANQLPLTNTGALADTTWEPVQGDPDSGPSWPHSSGRSVKDAD